MITETRKKKSKKSCGFQSMGLSREVLKGVLRKGYKVPSPIQRKAIPLIMEGNDIVAMARTGSGKTAAFLVPLFERLKSHTTQTGARALILSPTRELAFQTYKFIKEIGRFTDLRSALISGGESMDKQFATIHETPDIIVATPGRFLHVIVEMNLKLHTVEYVVFDEADRLFEMGFKEQLNEILSRLPEHRQTLLFSATLPQMIVDFSKAGLRDPILVRLDTESKLSDNLKTVYLSCRDDDKVPVLLYLLKNVIKTDEMTVVFVATRHHVEYIVDLLTRSGVRCTYLYSTLDHDARKTHISLFQSKKTKVMVVTDVAARGVDIPMLDNVINLNFPAKPKLFVHRVGRVARAGRIGTAYSLIAFDETPYFHSLHLFLNHPLKYANLDMKMTESGVYGSVPQNIIDDESEILLQWHSTIVDLKNMKKVCKNAYAQYVKSRPSPAGESVKTMKESLTKPLSIHPIFKVNSNDESFRNNYLESIKNYRPNSTIFEVGNTKKSSAFDVMQKKRKMFDKVLNKSKVKNDYETLIDDSKKFRDDNFYLNYQSDQHYSEKGLEIEKPFNTEIASAVLDLNGDDAQSMHKSKNSVKWDRRKKRFVGNNDDASKKKIKTESGTWICASYKSDLYNKWKQKSKIEKQENDDDGGDNEEVVQRNKNMKNKRNKKCKSKRPPKRELKTKDEILKERMKMEKKKSFQNWRRNEKAKKKVKNTKR